MSRFDSLPIVGVYYTPKRVKKSTAYRTRPTEHTPIPPGFSDGAMADRPVVRRYGAGEQLAPSFFGRLPTGLREVNEASGFRFRISPAR